MSATARIVPFPDRRERLVTLRELMERYSYSERWFRYRIADGMPCVRWGKRLRFRPDDVEQWLEERYGET